MLEIINFEVFGAFGAVLGILLWVAIYFKKQSEQKDDQINRMQSDRLDEQAKQLDALETTNEILREMLSNKEDED